MHIFWMNGQTERLTLRVMALDELQKEAKCLCAISSSLVVMIDKEVENPVVV